MDDDSIEKADLIVLLEDDSVVEGRNIESKDIRSKAAAIDDGIIVSLYTGNSYIEGHLKDDGDFLASTCRKDVVGHISSGDC